jgi:hypothetical protein
MRRLGDRGAQCVQKPAFGRGARVAIRAVAGQASHGAVEVGAEDGNAAVVVGGEEDGASVVGPDRPFGPTVEALEKVATLSGL